MELALSLSLTRASRGAAGGFTPASLFASGEGGCYFINDIATMWQDTGGTTAAVVDQAVARWDDQSGNGNHATQGTAAAQPILRQTAGGVYYLELDRTDDTMLTPAFELTDASGHHSAIAGIQNGGTGGAVQSVLDADGTGDAGRISQVLRLDSGGSIQSIAFNDAGSAFTDSGPSLAGNTDGVLSEITADSAVEAFLDGAGSGGSTAITGTMKTGNDPLRLGAQEGGTAQLFGGRMYCALFVARKLTAEEHSDGVSWAQGRMP